MSFDHTPGRGGATGGADPRSEAATRQAEAALESLRISYEQYFAGVSRRPPFEQEKAVLREVEQLRGKVRGSALRFRVESLHQRLQSYRRMWARTVREIEEGTYHRDVFKARLRSKARQASSVPEQGKGTGDRLRPKSPAGQTAPAAAEQPRALLPGEGELRQVHAAFLEAKRLCNEPTDGLSFERLAQVVRRQAESLAAKHGGAVSVDLRVQVRNGKAVLQAAPRKRDPT